MKNISLKYINKYNNEVKTIFMENIENKVDTGIKSLVDAINSIEDLVTMNSCQGALIEEDEYEHCPITYVDFYVLNHNYYIAHNLFHFLVHKYGDDLNCQVTYEADFDFISEDTVEDNGFIDLRFKLQLNYPNPDIYASVVESVNEYRDSL